MGDHSALPTPHVGVKGVSRRVGRWYLCGEGPHPRGPVDGLLAMRGVGQHGRTALVIQRLPHERHTAPLSTCHRDCMGLVLSSGRCACVLLTVRMPFSTLVSQSSTGPSALHTSDTTHSMSAVLTSPSFGQNQHTLQVLHPVSMEHPMGVSPLWLGVDHVLAPGVLEAVDLQRLQQQHTCQTRRSGSTSVKCRRQRTCRPSPNRSFLMASKHFCMWGCTACGSLCTARHTHTNTFEVSHNRLSRAYRFRALVIPFVRGSRAARRWRGSRSAGRRLAWSRGSPPATSGSPPGPRWTTGTATAAGVRPRCTRSPTVPRQPHHRERFRGCRWAKESCTWSWQVGC